MILHPNNVDNRSMWSRCRCALVPIVAGGFTLLSGATHALAQEEIWFASSDAADEILGWVDVGVDVDGDQVAELLLGNDAADCANVDDGMVQLISTRSGELARWCGDLFWGKPVAWADDIDGLGMPDVLVSQPGWYEPTTFGFHTGRIQLISAESGTLIREWIGSETGGLFGLMMDVLGDIDGDGFRELLVGVSGQGGSSQGQVWIYSIRTGKQLRTHYSGVPYARLGTRVRSLGDVDGDLVADYAYLSTPGGFSTRVNIRSGATGAQVAKVDNTATSAPNGNFAPFVDLDGDGSDEMLISGQYFATSGGYVEAFSPASGATIWRVDGAPTLDQFGFGIVGLSDMNDDGFAEFIVSAPSDGTRGRLDGRVDLISGRTLRPLYVFYPPVGSIDLYGDNLARGADFNGDGIEDVVIGSWNGGWSRWQGGFVGIYAGNDLFLQAEPQKPLVGDTVVVDLRGAAPGLLGLVALIAIDGTPTWETLLLTPFDSNSELQLCADIDPSVSGMDFTLMAWAQNKNGRGPLVDATPFVVSVQ